MRLIFAGSGEFGIPSLEAMQAAGLEIALVITQPDRPAGRGRQLTPTPIAARASTMGLTILKTADVNAESLPPADLMVVIAFGQKIAENQVHHARLGSINLHGSRLPRHRGAAPINAAILAGDPITGNTIIRVAPKMDAGDILGISEVPIGELETAGELHDRLSLDGAPLLLKVIRQLQSGSATETPQDHSLATKAAKLSRQSAQIDWNRSADLIARQIRGMSPWPGCHARLVDEQGKELARVALVRARPAAESGPAAGAILPSGFVGTGLGSVEILELQPEGKRPMPLSAFKNGHPWRSGMWIESSK